MAADNFVVLDTSVLAAWLQAQPPNRLWSVDGEENLAGRISFPCTGEDLAPYLGELGRVRIFSTADATEAWEKNHDVEALAQDEGGATIFAIGGEGDPEPQWLLVEDTIAEAAAAAGL